MKVYNWILFGLGMCMYIYTLKNFDNILISIGFGVLSMILLFLDDLTYKPIKLIGWTITKEPPQKQEQK